MVGGGPTGVELAGQIGEIARDTVSGDFRAIDPTSARIVLLEGLDRILTAFHPSLSARAERALSELGVTVSTSAMVEDIDAGGVTVRRPDGATERIPARTVIWAAGVQASGLAGLLAAASGAEVDRAGRVTVEPDLTLPGHPEVIALGDMVRVSDGVGGVQDLPGVGARRHAAGPPRRAAGGGAAGGRGGAAPVPLRRQGQPGDDRPAPRGGRDQGRAAERLPGVGGLARHPPLLPDRPAEPRRRADSLDGQLPHPRSRGAADRAPDPPPPAGSSSEPGS